MKGKRIFTQEEADQIRYNLRLKAGADQDTQKKLRGKNRKIGFYIDDFATDSAGFLPEDFDRLVATGAIKIEGKGGDVGLATPQATIPVSKNVGAIVTDRGATKDTLATIDFTSISGLRAYGFTGFCSVRDLQASRCREVVDDAGVYVVLRSSHEEPAFTEMSCGGRFKERDPSVPIPVLRSNWVSDAIVLYIGKAGGGVSQATLRKRLKSYMEFGSGKPVGHWGGRFIWHLADATDLQICWKPSGATDAAELETSLLRDFTKRFGARPFANLRD